MWEDRSKTKPATIRGQRRHSKSTTERYHLIRQQSIAAITSREMPGNICDFIRYDTTLVRAQSPRLQRIHPRCQTLHELLVPSFDVVHFLLDGHLFIFSRGFTSGVLSRLNCSKTVFLTLRVPE